jgi:glycosyltransferase involved in cell wall biosynthesis
MKVAVLSRVAHPLHAFGGLERHVGAMVRYLSREGAEVTLITSPPDEDVSEIDGVRVVPVAYRSIPWPRQAGFVIADRNTNYLIWNIRAARKVVDTAADIVHAEAGAGFGYARLPSSRRVPFVIQAQGMEEFKTGWFKRTAYLPLRLATLYAAKRAEKVIVPDRAMEKEVQRYLGVPAERTWVVPLAVDLDEIDRSVSESARTDRLERWSIPPKTTVILSVGRLESNKGFPILAEALSRASPRIPHPWIWVVVGKGPLESQLQKKVRDLSIADSCRWVGRVHDEDLTALYTRADLFVHPTLYEGSSLVTLEAMAHRKPVVATEVGGIPDKVAEGKNGFLVPPGDADAMAAAVEKAFSLGPDLSRLGDEGRRRVEAEFNWSTRARRLIDLYRSRVRPSEQ